MLKAQNLALAALLMVAVGSALGAGSTELYFDQKNCALKQAGQAGAHAWDGKVTQFGCVVSIPRNQYERQFRFCFLSGVTVYGRSGPSSCRVSYAGHIDAYRFTLEPAEESATGPVGALDCTFTCIPR